MIVLQCDTCGDVGIGLENDQLGSICGRDLSEEFDGDDIHCAGHYHYPVKQVIVMRNDLNMRKGKMIAQGAHASIAFLTTGAEFDDWGEEGRRFPILTKVITPQAQAWIEDRFTKVCVKVDSLEELTEIVDRARDAQLAVSVITDAGLTEFNGVPTVTCAAIGPDLIEKIDTITGHLPLL